MYRYRYDSIHDSLMPRYRVKLPDISLVLYQSRNDLNLRSHRLIILNQQENADFQFNALNKAGTSLHKEQHLYVLKNILQDKQETILVLFQSHMLDTFQRSQDNFMITRRSTNTTGTVFPLEEQSTQLPFYIQFYFSNKGNNLHFYRIQF